MSRRIQIMRDDDWDRSPADETVEITVDGWHYETDLTAERAAEFREVLRPWLEAAFKKRRLKTRKKKAAPAPAPAARKKARGKTGDGGATAKALAVADPQLRKAMRAWAERNGYALGRGLIPREVQAGYRADAGLEEAG